MGKNRNEDMNKIANTLYLGINLEVWQKGQMVFAFCLKAGKQNSC